MPTKTLALLCASLMVALGGGVTAQAPIRPVAMTPFADGQASVLNADLLYQIGRTKFIITVPEGFVTDFASTPRAIWAILPPVDKYQLAAVVHDFLYWDQRCTREQADDLLRSAMAESGVDRIKRDIIWQAVRRFGQAAWNTNAAEKVQGQPRVIPRADLSIPALATWPEYRKQLVTKGVRPVAPAPGIPEYCTAAATVVP